MTDAQTYFRLTTDDKTRIQEAASDTADVLRKFGKLAYKTKRNSQISDCPQCGAKDGLEIMVSGAKKGIFKCFHCGVGGKGGVAYLMDMQNASWKEAVQWVAKTYAVEIEGERAPTRQEVLSGKNTVTFRDVQLQHSGIPVAAQKIMMPVESGKSIEQNRYTSGTMLDGGEYAAQGDDMVLWYLGLDAKQIMWKPKNGGKPKPLIRVRYKHPDLHLDKEGRSVKYRSPYGSGSHVWLPNAIIGKYAKREKIRRLDIVEGEKKSDKMCLHGLDAVGIMGIHNFAYEGEMPRAFEMLISQCQVEEVCFHVDSDWQNISSTPGKSVDQRPRTFLRAVQKFREYFHGFKNSGIELRIYFCAGKSAQHKGLDDLLSALQSEGKETLGQPGVLALDIDRAIADATGQGEYVQARNIHPLRVPEQKLLEMWYLHDPQSFFEVHKDALRSLGEFQFGKLTYFWNAETQSVELANQILDSEKFYDIQVYTDRSGREKRECSFNYDTIRNFLYNRGIGLYELADGQYRFVRRVKTTIADISHVWIQRYVVEFAETIKDRQERSDVVQMLLRGNTQYLGPNNLNYMRTIQPDWLQHTANEQYMVFRNVFWRITADGIEERPIAELPGNIWEKQVIQHEASYIGKPLLSVAKGDAGWKVKETPEADKCEMFQYIKCVSLFCWQKLYELDLDAEGNKKYFPKAEPEALTASDLKNWHMHIATKLIAWGYKMRTYRDQSQMRAIICMDGLESQVGRSQGGSGKSIYAMATQFCQPLFTVDGKTADLKSDKFVYHGVDDRTREIVIDDVGVNFPFELLFSQITNFIRVKPFQGAPITLPAPVFTITTNHTLNGEGNSFKRRQYLLGFSNFFNEHRTPAHHFGHQLFLDWNAEQWNLYYNLMATCIQVYMQYSDLGRYAVESEDIEKRQLRQKIGEDFLDFADGYFVEGYMINRTVVKERVLDDYLAYYPGQARFTDARKIKDKCALYAKYRGLHYNPTAGPDGRIKSSGFEFVLVADDSYKASADEKVYKGTTVSRTEPAAF